MRFTLCGSRNAHVPLTENFPKPLLPIGGKPLIDYLIDDLSKNADIKKFVVVSDHKFINHFNARAENRGDDIVVLAGDNLLKFSLKNFVDFFRVKGGNVVMRYYEKVKNSSEVI